MTICILVAGLVFVIIGFICLITHLVKILAEIIKGLDQ